MRDVIYIVTAISTYSEKDFEKDPKLKEKIENGLASPYSSTRAVGWLPTFEEADKRVRNNDCDIYEYCYTYAVIEETPSGYYPMASIDNSDVSNGTVLYFYKYDDKTRKYVKLDECPKELLGNKHCLYYGTLG